MMRLVDDFIDRTTMFRLMAWYMAALLIAAAALGLVGLTPYDPGAIALSTGVAVVSALALNWGFAKAFALPTNYESALITALIIALIMNPVQASDLPGVGGIVFASGWAIASKFMLVYRRKHIFNPAALGVMLTGLLINQPATWWIGGNVYLLPFVLAGGLLVTRKLQRADLIVAFLAANLLTVIVATPLSALGQALTATLTQSPLFFLGFAMLTEPLTAPQARVPRLIYAAIVGVLSAPVITINGFFLTPELALMVGNIFTFITSPRGRYVLTLDHIEQVARDAYDFVFTSNRPIRFAAGQYLDWTLPVRAPDQRGNRRTLTIASAPSDDEVRLGVKFYPHPSAFKQALAALQPGDQIQAGQLAGGFVLPRNPNQKLAFIAGGIGITPFRSMIRELLNTGEKREIVLLYGNATTADIAYRDVFDAAAQRFGLRTIHVLEREEVDRGDFASGYVDAQLIRECIPDYRDRLFYVSGPHVMVEAVTEELREVGVPRHRIRTDFFPGYA